MGSTTKVSILRTTDGRTFYIPFTTKDTVVMRAIIGSAFETFTFVGHVKAFGSIVYKQINDGRTCPAALPGAESVGMELTPQDKRFLKTMRIQPW
mgnify:CR=1 FL=1